MNETINFCGGTIITGDEMTVVEGKTLVAANEHILHIGAKVKNGKTVDMSGKLLCPMFINAHSHLGDSGAKELGVGLPLEKVVVPPDGLKHRFLAQLSGSDEHIAMMRHGLIEMLHNGIIASADFREQGIEGVHALRQAAKGLPIRTIILGRMDEFAADESILAQGQRLLEEAEGLGVRDVSSYPADVIQTLRQSFPDKILAFHVSEDRQAELKSRQTTGRGQVARALDFKPNLLVHLTHALCEELKQAAAQDVFAVACPSCNGILGGGLPRLAVWQQQGLQFALGSDNMMFNPPDMLREMNYASRMTRGIEQNPAAIDARSLLKAATILGARALKLDGTLGSLAEGKEASFIAFDLQSLNLTYQHDVISALVHRARHSDISAIYIRGTPLEIYLK